MGCAPAGVEQGSRDLWGRRRTLSVPSPIEGLPFGADALRQCDAVLESLTPQCVLGGELLAIARVASPPGPRKTALAAPAAPMAPVALAAHRHDQVLGCVQVCAALSDSGVCAKPLTKAAKVVITSGHTTIMMGITPLRDRHVCLQSVVGGQ